jgi:hypothetical protein
MLEDAAVELDVPWVAAVSGGGLALGAAQRPADVRRHGTYNKSSRVCDPRGGG